MEEDEQIKGLWRYAWHGSGRRWDAAWLQVAGGAIGGFAIWYWGLKVPSEILDNPAFSGIAAIAIGAICGALVAFVLRLFWYPVYLRYHSHGGLIPYLKARLGFQMLPTVLMISGLAAFMALFGTGALLFVFQGNHRDKNPTAIANGAMIPYEIERQLKGVDELRELIVGNFPKLSQYGRDLSSRIEGTIQTGVFAPSIADELIAYSKTVDEALSRVRESFTKYRDYPYMGTVQEFSQFNPYEVVASARNIANEIKRIPPGSPPQTYNSLLNNQYFVSLARATIELGNWSGKVDLDLSNSRKKILALPVLPPK